MKKSWAMKWAKALESGEYNQNDGILLSTDLPNGEHAFNAEGVLCNISTVDLEWVDEPDIGYSIGGCITISPDEVEDQTGFNVLSMFETPVPYNGNLYWSLQHLESVGAPFEYLAEVIRLRYKEL